MLAAGISPATWTNDIAQSELVTELGKWHTVRFNIPETKEELLELGWRNEAQANLFTEGVHPRKLFFKFTGASSGRQLSGSAVATPYIIQKVEFGYTDKPEWAE